jgi:hypothetical protein
VSLYFIGLKWSVSVRKTYVFTGPPELGDAHDSLPWLLFCQFFLSLYVKALSSC